MGGIPAPPIGAPGGIVATTDAAVAAVPSPNGVELGEATRPRRRLRFTVESLLYAAIIVAAILTRFWDLGSRALHHDESLHSYFSWLLATGQGYTHDPLMHGPFLFHFNALLYMLFGATDATSRATAAIAGVATVAMPWMLRGPRQLGRWGALFASFLLLISPSILYQSRYIRHDIFTVAGALLLFIAIVRYVDRPQRRWLVTMGVTLGFLLANHEIIFGIAAIFVAVIAGALCFGPLRRAGVVAVLVGAAALAVLRIVPRLTSEPLPAIPWRNPTQEDQRDFYIALFTHPLIIALLLLAVVGVAAIALVIVRQYGPERPPEGWIDRIFGGGADGSVQEAMRTALHDRQGLWLAFSALVIVFAVLFTTMFTNLYGLASGTVSTDGTLLYWLGQHDYRRGEQPWFYYLLLFPQYEFIPVLLGTTMSLVVLVRAVRVILGRAAMGPRFFTQMLLAIWYAGIFASLSWAGEKMPWLVVHITLPAILLAAALLGELAERWRPTARDLLERGRDRAGGWGWPEWAVTLGLLLAGGCWILIAGRLTYGQFTPSTDPGGWTRTLTSNETASWWLLAVPPAIALAALVAGVATRGVRRTGEAALTALVAGLAFLQVHTAWRLTYLEGDVPKDMLVYTQTAPDVTRVVDEMTALSETMTGGKGLEIWYDDNNGVSWPMQWYLRDFPNKHLYGSSLTTTPTAPIVLAGGDNVSAVQSAMQGYTAQSYVLRWWFPEDIYRNFAIAPELRPGRSAWTSVDAPHGIGAIAGSVWTSVRNLFTPEGQAQVYRLLMYRDLPDRIDSYRFTLYVRNDLLPLFNSLRY